MTELSPTTLFRRHTIAHEKPDGTKRYRVIYEPNDFVRRQHLQALHYFYKLGVDMPHATGSIPGKSVVDNIVPHIDNESRHFYSLDIANAFPNVDHDVLIEKVQRLVHEDDWHDVKEFIELYAIIHLVPGLPLGLPCSPFLFNIYCQDMDKEIAQICAEHDLIYTRYLDDLTFSSQQYIPTYVRKRLRNTVEATSGMHVNHRKAKCLQLGMGPVEKTGNGPITITGISIYGDGHVQLAPHLVESAHKAYDALLENDSLLGLPLVFDEDIGRAHGWHGVVTSYALPKRELTPAQRQLEQKYQEVLRALGLAATK